MGMVRMQLQIEEGQLRYTVVDKKYSSALVFPVFTTWGVLILK